MPTLTARTLITAIGTVAYPAIEIDSAGLITDISTDATIRSTDILTPTFLDIHTHGASGHDVMDADPAGLARMRRFLAAHGTGHFLPTTATAPLDATLSALEALADAIEGSTPPDQATPLGIHLEGPFLSHSKRGVHPAALLERPSIPLFDRLQQAARGHIRLLTLAPELPGARDLIAHAVAQGVRISLGHTNATLAETRAATAGIPADRLSATHTFNAMRPLDHREPGILGFVLGLTDPPESIFAELICDGIHVAPELVRLWLRLKQERALLVTDAISATGMPDGAYTLAGLPVTVSSAGGFAGSARASLTDAPETLAGSVLTLDRAVENLRTFTGCPLEDAVRAASSQPATLLGLADTVASLRPGQPANFNRYTAAGRLTATCLRGHRIA
jgi:N-acetylglucosamine-6-phosphate deacetylase